VIQGAIGELQSRLPILFYFYLQIVLVIGKASEAFKKGGLIGYADDEIDVSNFTYPTLFMSSLSNLITIGGRV